MSMAGFEGPRDRRRLTRSPLVNAIWQLKFTSDVDLRDGRAVVAFQSALGRDTVLAPVDPPKDPSIPHQQLPVERSWRVTSASDSVQLTLAPGVVTIETNEYGSWRNRFEGWVRDASTAVTDAFNPGLLTRTGLRYVNIVFGAAMERDPFATLADFRGVVAPPLLGIAAMELPGVEVELTRGREVLTIEDVTSNLNFVLVRTEEGEAGMVIDVDTYHEQTEPFEAQKVVSTSNRLHDIGLSLFQSCLTPESWEAMGPVEEAPTP